jgi:hypothetical protein
MFVYLIGYGVGRAWIEALRIDTFERYLGLSRNNWIAIAIVLVGIAGLIWWERRGSATDAEPAPAADGAVDADDADAPASDDAARPADPAASPTDPEAGPTDPAAAPPDPTSDERA